MLFAFVGKKLAWPKLRVDTVHYCRGPYKWLFFEHINSKTRTRENITLLLHEDGHLKKRDTFKAEKFITPFTFNSDYEL